MLDLLAKIVGPNRAVTIYVFLQRRGLAILGAVAFAAIVAYLLLVTGPEDHEHAGYFTAPVIEVIPAGNSTDNGALVEVVLPDHSTTRITAEGPVVEALTDTACVEKRIYVKSGTPRYRLKLPHYCQQAGG